MMAKDFNVQEIAKDLIDSIIENEENQPETRENEDFNLENITNQSPIKLEKFNDNDNNNPDTVNNDDQNGEERMNNEEQEQEQEAEQQENDDQKIKTEKIKIVKKKKSIKNNEFNEEELEEEFGGKRKKSNLENQIELDDEIADLRAKMLNANDQDDLDQKKHLPAIHKLTLLPIIKNILYNASYYQAILENGLLDSIMVWLEPFADGSLPCLDIQQVLMEGLCRLPIRTEHLRSSKLGKVIFFYTKCKRVTPDIKKKATHLVNKWIRPVINQSANPLDKQFQSTNYSSNNIYSKKSQSGNILSKIDSETTKMLIDDEIREVRVEKHRATVPSAYDGIYEVVPISKNIEGRKKRKIKRDTFIRDK